MWDYIYDHQEYQQIILQGIRKHMYSYVFLQREPIQRGKSKHKFVYDYQQNNHLSNERHTSIQVYQHSSKVKCYILKHIYELSYLQTN